jgi:glycosyltransferase involved in cell wall biosynthesis
MKIVAMNWRDLAHPSAGGSEVLIDRLLRELALRGHDVTLVCGGPVAPHDYEVVSAGGTYSQYLRAPWVSMTKFNQADLVIDIECGMPYFTPLWRRGPSICLVHHVHTDQWQTKFPGPVAQMARAVERHVVPAAYRNRLFVAISQSTADDLVAIGVPCDHVRVIEPGVDLPEDSALAESPTPLFLALARLVPHKRVDLLLETWRKVQPVTGGRFVVVGSGPELDGLRQQAAGIPGAELVGRVDEEEKSRLLGEAWFLVHGAHHEGWGMCIMEAAAAGTPTLAVNASGVRDAVLDGTTGVIVDAAEPSLPDALAEAWIALAVDTERRGTLGVASRVRAADFGWGRMAESWIKVADEAMALSAALHRGSGWRSRPAAAAAPLHRQPRRRGRTMRRVANPDAAENRR